MYRILLLLYCSLLLIPLYADSDPEFGVANYEIHVELDPERKWLTADQTIIFINPSADTIRELFLHLYYNAFKSTESTFLSGSGGLADFIDQGDGDDCPFSYTEVHSIRDASGSELIQQMNYFIGPHSNPSDETVVRIALNDPVLPYDTLKLNLQWEAKIPRIMPRTGTNKDFYFFAQWFPKLGVYEAAGTRYAEEGVWNCHPYFSSGEFYADFGFYDVHIKVPEDYWVGSSGSLKSKMIEDGFQIWNFQIDKVIDFAWTASPHFIEQSLKYNDISIKLLSYPDHEHCAEKYFMSVKNAIEYLKEYVGPYPYQTITIIDVPIHGLFTGGMEYPTLITSMSFCFLPVGIKTTQTLTIHEFIHQYFMQLVASNETEEPWMDEGITSYYEGRIVDHYYGEDRGLIEWMGAKISNTAYNRWEYFASENPSIADNTYKSWEFTEGGYKMISYNKTAVWLNTLEGLVGRPVMDQIMQSYVEKWKFRHPCARDFEAVVNEVVSSIHGDKIGENLDWFFDQVLRGSGQCDYEVSSIRNRERSGFRGFKKGERDCIDEPNYSENEIVYDSEVVFSRLDDLYFPQEYWILFDDGSIEEGIWDGKDRTFKYQHSGTKKVRAARIDPEYKIKIDRNIINNGRKVEADQNGIRYYFTRFLQSAQNIMETISWLA